MPRMPRCYHAMWRALYRRGENQGSAHGARRKSRPPSTLYFAALPVSMPGVLSRDPGPQVRLVRRHCNRNAHQVRPPHSHCLPSRFHPPRGQRHPHHPTIFSLLVCLPASGASSIYCLDCTVCPNVFPRVFLLVFLWCSLLVFFFGSIFYNP